MNYWLYPSTQRSKGRNRVKMSQNREPTITWNTFWTDWIIVTNSNSLSRSESLVYSYCSLGLSFPLKKNNATPCGVTMLFQRVNQYTEEVKRQGTTTGNASWYRGQKARGCLIRPFVCNRQSKMGEARINPRHHPPDVLPQEDPIQARCSCMPLF